MNIKHKTLLLLSLSSMLLIPRISYSIPLNAKPDGDNWKCKIGFKKQQQQCNRIFVPPNATLEGTEWLCNEGYQLQGSQCNEVTITNFEPNQSADLSDEQEEIQTYDEDLELAESYYSEGEYSEALVLFQRLKDERTGRAQLHLAFMHDFGHGVLTNKKRAASYYLKAARHGHVEAQRNIGTMLSNGEILTQNHRHAVYWFEKAAIQGDAESQYSLGNYYDNGTAGIRSYKKSTYWYRQSAEQGHLPAQYLLGLYYCIGKGVGKDLQQCALWTKRAHENGHSDASKVWDKYKLWKHL